jgi:hypothetical protein
MARKARVSKGKTMRPNFFVFCEGKTEITYVEFLRSVYRVPIQIIPRKGDSSISDKYIKRCKDEYVATKNDKTFVIFDLDVDGILERLSKLKDTILLVSNPCIEVWFLLHVEDFKSEISSADCVKRLSTHFKKYKKGALQEDEKAVFISHLDNAITRAEALPEYGNPSSCIYKLIKEIQSYV